MNRFDNNKNKKSNMVSLLERLKVLDDLDSDNTKDSEKVEEKGFSGIKRVAKKGGSKLVRLGAYIGSNSQHLK